MVHFLCLPWRLGQPRGVYFIVYPKAMAPHSSTLTWKIPWMEEPGRLQSIGWLGLGYDWATSLYFFTFMHWRRKWQPTPMFLPGESQGQGSLVGCRLWGCTESDTLKRLSSSSSRGHISPCVIWAIKEGLLLFWRDFGSPNQGIISFKRDLYISIAFSDQVEKASTHPVKSIRRYLYPDCGGI